MNIDSIGIQQGAAQGKAQGAKSAAANDPLAALFAEFLDLADGLVGDGTDSSAKTKKTDDTSAQQNAQLVASGTPFMPLPVAAQTAAAAQKGGTSGEAKVETASTGAASASTGAKTPAGGPLPITVPKPDAETTAADASDEAAAAVTEAKPDPKAAPAKAAAQPETVPPLVINLSPKVTLAAPKTVAAAGAEKAKPAASSSTATKSTGPVSVTVEKAAPPAQPAESSHRAEASAPVAAASSAEPDDRPTTAPAKPDATAPAAPLAPAAPTDQVAAAKPAPTQPAATPLHPATEQLVHRVEKAIEHGEDKIRIELKPASLGGVEVQLHIADDGRVSAVVRADRADTLALLQNDVRGLEQALKDAGLRPDAGSLSFNLRQGEGQAGNQPDARGQRRRGNSERATFAIDGVGSEAPDPRSLLSGLDIRI